MINFEKIYQINPSREIDYDREKHPFIELTDKEIIGRMKPPEEDKEKKKKPAKKKIK